MSSKVSKKAIIFFLLIGAGVAGFSQLLYSTLGENAVEAMKSVIDADAALVGFLAVVAIFLMTSIQGVIRRIHEKLQVEERSHKDYLQKFGGDDVEYGKYKKKILRFSYFSGYFTEFMGFIMFALFFSVICLVLSILIALLGMSTDSFVKIIGFSGSIFLWFTGLPFCFTF